MALDLYPVDGPWAGKLAVCARPRSGTWIDDDVLSLKAAGFDLLVSAITAEEMTELHLRDLPTACVRHGIEHVHFPIGNLQVPPLERALPLLQTWASLLDTDRSIAMHCFASVGRSPTLAAALLVLRGVPDEVAWHRLAESRGREVPDTLEQRRWVSTLAQKERPNATLG